VVGGWHASDEHLRVACFGKTEVEAIDALSLALQEFAEWREAAEPKTPAKSTESRPSERQTA